MKSLALALFTYLGCTVVGYSQPATQPPSQKLTQTSAQTSAQTPAQGSAPSSSGSESVGRSCKKELKQLCGRRARGQEEQDSIKANLDLNKFSADCKAELSKTAKPSS